MNNTSPAIDYLLRNTVDSVIFHWIYAHGFRCSWLDYPCLTVIFEYYERIITDIEDITVEQ